MIEALKLEVGVPKEVVTQHLDSRFDEWIRDEARPKRIAWNIEEISEATGLKDSYLKRHVLCDPRVKPYERRNKKGLTIWMYEGSWQAIKEVLDDWY